MKDVPKAEESTDVKLTTFLKKFSGAKARRIVKKDTSTLNTVKSDSQSEKKQEKRCLKDFSWMTSTVEHMITTKNKKSQLFDAITVKPLGM